MYRVIPMVLMLSASLFAADDFFDQWIKGPVRLIMNEDEAKDFGKLQTPEAKLMFMRIFWARRDPNPDTAVNEFKAEFERRVATANELYARSNIPGWQMAMGQVYIIYGKPVRTERKILDGRRAELWWYGKLKLPYLDPNEAFAFIELYGDGRMLLLPPNTDYGSAVDYASRMAEIRGATVTSVPYRYVQATETWNDRSVEHPEINYDELLLTGKVSTEYEVKLIAFSWEAQFSGAPAGKRKVRVAVSIPYKEMTFAVSGEGSNTSSMVLRVTVKTSKGDVVASADKVITVQKTQDELSKIGDSAHQDAVELDLTPGSYQVELVLEDNSTSRVGYLTQPLNVPAGG